MSWQTIEGWLSEAEGAALQAAARGKRVLEIGSYCGRSAACLAQVATSVHAVDPHDGRGVTRDGRNTLAALMRNLADYRITNVVPIVGTIEDVAPRLQRGAYDMIFIDGDHSKSGALRDLRIADSLLAPGGTIAVHDYGHPWHPGVRAAIEEWQGDRPMTTVETLALFEPPTTRALATIGTGTHRAYLDLTLPLMHGYADLHGYDVVVGSGRSYGRPAAWAKIPLIMSLLKTYQQVLWIDADAVILRPDADVASAVAKGAWQALVVNRAVVRRRTREVPNTGVWFLRPAMLPHLASAWGRLDRIHHHYWEQAAVMDEMGYRMSTHLREGNLARPPRKSNDLCDHTTRLPRQWNLLPHRHAIDDDTRIAHPAGALDRLTILRDLAGRASAA